MHIQAGTIIRNFKIVELIGRGGMAEVYRARHMDLDVDVSIKFIRMEHFPQEMLPEIIQRFQNEAKHMAKLSHPNIVKVTDYGTYQEAPYFVMEYLPGGTLRKYQGKTMPYRQAVQLLLPIASALAYAHSKGIIHHDVKPGNILITKDGSPMLSDFGVAKVMNSDETQGLTATGAGIGAPGYMAPEQILGEKIDQRVDVYAMGVILYELLTGKKPFGAETPMKAIIRQIKEPLTLPSEYIAGLPKQVETILTKALANELGDRYADMKTFAKELQDLLSDLPQDSTQITEQPKIEKTEDIPEDEIQERKRKRRRKLIAYSLGIIILGSITFIGIRLMNNDLHLPAFGKANDPIQEEVSIKRSADPAKSVTDYSQWAKNLGTEENPIIFAAVPSGETERVLSGFERMSALLYESTGLVIEPFVATSYSGVIEALCQDQPKAHMASLSTFSYILAAEKGCAETALVSMRYGSAYYNGQFMVRSDSGINSLEDLVGATWCVPDIYSTSGYVIPSIMLQGIGIDPDYDLGVILQAGSHEAAAAGAFIGDCDFATTYVDARTTIEEDYPRIVEETKIIALEPDIPNDGIQFVPGFPEEIKETLIQAILDLFETEEGTAAMGEAYSWTGMEEHNDTYYDPFRQILDAAGVSAEDLAGY
jgi:phosphonate transport system substrate-binding protein